MPDVRELKTETSRHIFLRDWLIANDPDLESDERTLRDTLEGLTDLNQILAAVVRSTLEDETIVGMLKVRMSEMHDRLERYERRASIRRQAVRDAMSEAGIDRLIEADFTATMKHGPRSVLVTDESKIPDAFFRIKRELKKSDIGNALKNGETVDGVVLSNPTLVLMVRTR